MRRLNGPILFLGFSILLSGCLGRAWLPFAPQAQRDGLQEFQLLRITSDASDLAYDLKGARDQIGALRELRYHSSAQDYRMELTNLAGGKVLFEYRGHVIAILYSEDFNPERGGHFSMDYIQNAITGNYDRFNFWLERAGDDWKLFTVGARPRKFTGLFLETNRILGQVIGIDSIDARAR